MITTDIMTISIILQDDAGIVYPNLAGTANISIENIFHNQEYISSKVLCKVEWVVIQIILPGVTTYYAKVFSVYFNLYQLTEDKYGKNSSFITQWRGDSCASSYKSFLFPYSVFTGTLHQYLQELECFILNELECFILNEWIRVFHIE